MNTEHLVNAGPESIMITNEESKSKRTHHKLQQYLKRKEARRESRKAYKERRKLRQKICQSSCVLVNSDIVNDNSCISIENPLHFIDNYTSHKSKRLKMSESLCQTKVVIDCAYDHLMSFKDICKLASQVANCYSINRRAEHPVQLYITGLGSRNTTMNDKDISKEDDYLTVDKLEHQSIRLYDRLKLSNCDSWDVNLCEDDYTRLFSADKIVYLCAESEHLLPDNFDAKSTSIHMDNSVQLMNFTQNDIYVIGGLIDHNNLKGYCYQQAIKRGHRTARLPLKEVDLHIEGRNVLSTVHVFQALCPVLSGTKTWLESLKHAIPPRKLLSV
ncbi:tRNA methyltransferase 10 like [Schistosoma japonicum]|nr:tRNA methyltransferase 10 like [Schistosoma japonicum]